MNIKFIFIILMTYLPFKAFGQIFELKVTDYGTLGGNATFRSFIDTQIQEVENEVNKDLPNAQPKRIMEGMANSSALATKGIGTDYASHMDVFLLGAGAGVAMDTEKDNSTDSDVSGIGIASGVVAGLDLGVFGWKRWNAYGNLMSYTLERTINGSATEGSKASVNMFTAGFHLRYDLVDRYGGKMLGWGGLKLHFGYDYNSTLITFKSQIREVVDETSTGGERIQGTIIGNPQASFLATTHSLPFEISTDVQILYLLSLYGGIGTDLNFGQATGKANLNADESTLNCTGGACGGGDNMKVQASANINTNGQVYPFFVRGFFGAQINLPFFQVYGQINKTAGNGLVSGSVGARFVY